jgi:hypothetical protein
MNPKANVPLGTGHGEGPQRDVAGTEQIRKQKRSEKRDRLHYKFEPKASSRPSPSFTTNSREFHGMLARPRVNSTPCAAYSA